MRRSWLAIAVAALGFAVAGATVQAAEIKVISTIGVKAGAPKPDISTPEALKRTLLAAKTIGYSKPGASGVLFLKIVEQMGITNEIAPKLVDAEVVGVAIAKGDAEIGIQQIPELMAVPGVDIAGPLPGAFQVITTFSAGLDAKAKEKAAAEAFIKFLAAAGAGAVYKSKGLDPGV